LFHIVLLYMLHVVLATRAVAIVVACVVSQMLHVWLQVVLLSSHVNSDDFVVRNFTIRNMETGELRNVTQFHYVSWPSSGSAVPESINSLLDFRR